MKVFLSWSGKYSQRVAAAMKEWLPLLINEIDPFMSSSIDAGSRWQAEISSELEKTDFGIVFVTAENQGMPWLNFEAGALAKSVSQSHVVPLAIDLKLSDIRNPLGQFQAQELGKDGVANILRAINSSAQKPLVDELLGKALDMWWPDLEGKVEAIRRESLAQNKGGPPQRSEREMLEEVLSSVRDLSRSQRAVLEGMQTWSNVPFRYEARSIPMPPSEKRRMQKFMQDIAQLIRKDAPTVTFEAAGGRGLKILLRDELSAETSVELRDFAAVNDLQLEIVVIPAMGGDV
ncbi:hypothetical protein ACWEOG_19320 [Amycolatopsis japonica]